MFTDFRIKKMQLFIKNGGIIIKRLIDFHLIHDNVRFEIKDNVRLDEEYFEETWLGRNFAITLKLKNKNSKWDDITKKSYGNKELRFTNLLNGKHGVWIVQKISYEKLLGIENAHKFSKCVEYNEFEYEIVVDVSLEIKQELIERRHSQKQSHRGRRKNKLDNTKIQYICYNPKPYQGGSFSGK